MCYPLYKSKRLNTTPYCVKKVMWVKNAHRSSSYSYTVTIVSLTRCCRLALAVYVRCNSSGNTAARRMINLWLHKNFGTNILSPFYIGKRPNHDM